MSKYDGRRVRVLHVLAALNIGGVETWLLRLLREIDREHIQIDFCCLSGAEGVYAAEARSLGSEVHTCRLTKNLLSFNRRFAEILSAGEYDVVHSDVYLFSGYILRQAAKAGVERRFAHSFTSPPQVSPAVTRRVYEKVMRRWIKRYATLGMGNSRKSMASLFGDEWYMDENLLLLYLGIDLAPFQSAAEGEPVRPQWGIPAAAPVIGHVGRLSTVKNHRFFLEVARAVQARRQEVWFLLVGDGPMREELEIAAQKLGLANVVFAGSQTNVAPYFREMDLLLFPSLWEGLPTAVIEAQAADVYCLCSDVITDEVVVLPDTVQFLSLEDSVDEWAAMCLQMLDKPKISVGAGAEALAESPFSMAKNAKDMSRIYLADGRQAVPDWTNGDKDVQQGD